VKKVVIASTNSAKIEAVKAYFGDAFQYISINADSKVPSKPAEIDTVLGVINRLEDARKQIDGADFYVAIEGGFVEQFDNDFLEQGAKRIFSVGTVAGVLLRDQKLPKLGIGDCYQIPESAYECIKQGQSLNQIILELEKSEVASVDYKQNQGVIGFLSSGKVNRTQDSLQALINAFTGHEPTLIKPSNDKYCALDKACKVWLEKINNNCLSR